MKGSLLRAGEVVDNRYAVEDFVGAGGMQEVYKARDTVLERHVALKVPKNAASERRFRRSAILSARVNHPNAAKTLDYLEIEDRFFLIEEFVPGSDLSKIRARIPMMDPFLVAHILHHLAKGVAASHHAGIVHRDLKPNNVMVSDDFSFGVIKITDFGIAKMAQIEIEEAVETGGESITSSHTVMGALPYLSPEMVSSPKTAEKPADVWALGAMAFELLSGEKPFGRGLNAVEKIKREPSPTLPTQCVTNAQFRPLALQIYEIIRLCLQKDEKTRPSADQVLQMCENLCYPDTRRVVGRVSDVRHGKWGFITSASGAIIFFHRDSIYGAPVSVNDEVCFAPFPGSPKDRAHPVVRLVPKVSSSRGS